MLKTQIPLYHICVFNGSWDNSQRSMGITEGTLLGVLTVASLVFVWAAIRERDKQIEQEERDLYRRSIEKPDEEQDDLPADRPQDEAQQ